MAPQSWPSPVATQPPQEFKSSRGSTLTDYQYKMQRVKGNHNVPLVVSRAVEASLRGDRAGVQASRAQGDVAAEVAALLVATVVSSTSTSAALVRSLRGLGVTGSRRSGVLLAAPRTSGPVDQRVRRRRRIGYMRMRTRSIPSCK